MLLALAQASLICASVASTLALDVPRSDGPPSVFFLGVSKDRTAELLAHLERRVVGVCGVIAASSDYWEMHHKDDRTRQQYFGYFAHCEPGQLTIDAYASSYGSFAIDNITHAYTPRSLATKKFVSVLREPMDSMLAWYNLRRAQSLERCDDCASYITHDLHLDSFKQFFDQDPSHAIEAGSYVQTMRRFLQEGSGISRSQVFVFSYETLVQNTSDTLQRLTSFLGVTPTDFDYPVRAGLGAADLTPMECSDYLRYKPIFEERNAGLADEVNGHPDRPAEEPRFPAFTDRFAETCSGSLKSGSHLLRGSVRRYYDDDALSSGYHDDRDPNLEDSYSYYYSSDDNYSLDAFDGYSTFDDDLLQMVTTEFSLSSEEASQ